MLIRDINNKVETLLETSQEISSTQYYIAERDENDNCLIINCVYKTIHYAKEVMKNYETNNPSNSYYLIEETSTINLL